MARPILLCHTEARTVRARAASSFGAPGSTGELGFRRESSCRRGGRGNACPLDIGHGYRVQLRRRCRFGLSRRVLDLGRTASEHELQAMQRHRQTLGIGVHLSAPAMRKLPRDRTGAASGCADLRIPSHVGAVCHIAYAGGHFSCPLRLPARCRVVKIAVKKPAACRGAEAITTIFTTTLGASPASRPPCRGSPTLRPRRGRRADFVSAWRHAGCR
jgi:hypothetical protein